MITQGESLLGDLALRLARSPEDVATEALAYVLARSTTARALVQQLAEDWAGRELRPIVSFQSQVTGVDEARPDLEAHDADGRPVLIFENKFWASLTEGQPTTYLERLLPEGGVLCFVVPSSRTLLLWPELVRRIEESEGYAPHVVREDSELRVARVDDLRALVIVSWTVLIGRIRDILEADGDVTLLADLRQLDGLVTRLETTGYVPFTIADLTSPTPRHVVQLCDLLNTAVNHVLNEPYASKKGLKATAGAGWYGHYVRLHGFGCQLSCNAPMWHRYGRSPLWLWVRSPQWEPSEATDRALAAHFGRDECVTVSDGWGAGGTWLAVRIPEGQESDAVVRDIARQLAEVAEVLAQTAHEDASEAMPDEGLPAADEGGGPR